MPLTLSLSETNQTHAALVGIKAATLGELLRHGLPIPAGASFTTEAYRLILAPLEEKILARATPQAILDPVDIENVAEDIRGWIENTPLPDSIMTALTQTLASLDATSYIARTSMTSDELASAFGSGVKRAFLGLVGTDEVTKALGQCWATPFTSRALYYRNRKKIKQTSVELGVLLQPLLPAQAGGSLFTQNTHTGALNQIVIESIWGLGEPATSARVKADRFVIEKNSHKIVSDALASKLVKLDVAPDGHLQQLAIAEDLQDAPSLDDGQLVQLAELGEQIEKTLGAPQEIEWAHANGKIFILQARPIGQRK